MKELKLAEVEKINLPCPLCTNELNYHEAKIDDSGYYYCASVSCKCGFSFTPPRDFSAKIGESGWDAIRRDIKEKEVLIFSKFSKKVYR